MLNFIFLTCRIDLLNALQKLLLSNSSIHFNRCWIAASLPRVRSNQSCPPMVVIVGKLDHLLIAHPKAYRILFGQVCEHRNQMFFTFKLYKICQICQVTLISRVSHFKHGFKNKKFWLTSYDKKYLIQLGTLKIE